MSFTDYIKSIPDFIGGSGRTPEEVSACENQLDLLFSDEYRQYLLSIGLACFDGHELTGICDSPRLNVVDVTRDQRAINSEIPPDFYAVEDAGIDGIILWQNRFGEVFLSAPLDKPQKVAGSLLEFFSTDR